MRTNRNLEVAACSSPFPNPSAKVFQLSLSAMSKTITQALLRGAENFRKVIGGIRLLSFIREFRGTGIKSTFDASITSHGSEREREKIYAKNLCNVL